MESLSNFAVTKYHISLSFISCLSEAGSTVKTLGFLHLFQDHPRLGSGKHTALFCFFLSLNMSSFMSSYMSSFIEKLAFSNPGLPPERFRTVQNGSELT